MSKIEKLIAKLCPAGVEFKDLGQLATIETGEQLNRTELTEIGDYPVLNGGINPSGFYNEYNTGQNTIAVSQGGASAGYVNFVKTKFWAGAHCFVVKPTNSSAINRYLYFVLKNGQDKLQNAKLGAGIPGLNRRELQSFLVPIPPLAIQEEIVKALDNFTKLEAELEARRMQYKYYREELYTFGDEIEKKPLGEVGEFIRGRRFVRDDITLEGVPCIHYGEMYTHYKIWARESKSYLEPTLAAKLRVAKTNDVIIVAAGETVEDIGNGVA